MWKISTSKKKLDLGNYHKKTCTDFYIFVYLVFFIPTHNQLIVTIFIALVFRRCSLNRAWIMSPSKWWDWFHLISAVLRSTESYIIYDLWSVSAWVFLWIYQWWYLCHLIILLPLPEMLSQNIMQMQQKKWFVCTKKY